MIRQQQIDDFRNDGTVFLPGLFADHVNGLRAGVNRNLEAPGEFAAENLHDHEKGRFFDDYCNWQRISEFRNFIKNSQVGSVAAQLMCSREVQVFHDHVLIKEPGTAKPTPWHQDAPYYFVDGSQTISFWIPLDPVKEASLRLIKGSHLWPKPVLPQRWLSEDDFYPDENDFLPIPDPDAEPGQFDVVEWEMKPGDAVAFHFKTVHGARGNLTNQRRRAFSLRLVGDDARYTTRPGKTSPPFPGHEMVEGEKLREDWFPIIWQS